MNGTEKTVAILGAGFAGVTLARQLEKRLPPDWDILLLSRENYITYHPLLGEVVGASILPGHVVAPVRQMIRRARFRMVDVQRVDLQERRLHGYSEQPVGISYHHLVLACGVRANLDLVPGMAEHALPLKMLGDALHLRNRVLVQLERADAQMDRERRRRLTTFLIVGGGFSGVEVAGELHDFLASAQRYYPNVPREDCRVILVHSRDRLLGEISDTLGQYAYRKMRKAGIDVRLNARAADVDEAGIELTSGERIAAATVVCTIGTAPHPLIQALPIAKERGALTTDPDMSVPDCPGLWALGDCAQIINDYDHRRCPPTAQFAIQQAKQLAGNIACSIAGRATKPFRYRSRGQLTSIGRNKAVAEVYRIRISGFPAWLLWRGFYLLKIPTLLRKVRIFFEWNWEMLFPPDIVHLRFTRSMEGARTAETEKHSHQTQDGARC